MIVIINKLNTTITLNWEQKKIACLESNVLSKRLVNTLQKCIYYVCKTFVNPPAKAYCEIMSGKTSNLTRKLILGCGNRQETCAKRNKFRTHFSIVIMISKPTRSQNTLNFIILGFAVFSQVSVRNASIAIFDVDNYGNFFLCS